MKKEDQELDHRKTLFEWGTPSFVPLQRGKMWYIVAGLIMGAFIIYALLSGSFSMAIAFILIGILFMIVENRSPRRVQVRITDMGIEYDEKFYSYHHINAFWIVYHPPYIRSLYLRLSTGRTFSYVKIELDEQSPVVIRSLLLKEIPEIEGAGELTTDFLARILRIQ